MAQENGTARKSLTLLIDADDTLWENNVYFEQSVEEFIEFLNHSTLNRAEVRAVLNEIERANAAIHGYGARAFTRSLQDCYERLLGQIPDDDNLRIVMRFGERILEQEIELLPGVEETLIELATRHQLVMFTKGHLEEQRLKIERSGIEHYFVHREIVPEKDESAYLSLIDRLGVEPVQGWMIGNSPKSDINPALAIGLSAVFIPHDKTWSLEHATIEHSGDRLIQLERFTQLKERF